MPVKMAPEVLAKTDDEIKFYNFEFADELETGEAITGATAAAVPSTGITLASATYDGTVAQVKITAGTAGLTYTITMQITTDAGETIQGSGALTVGDI